MNLDNEKLIDKKSLKQSIFNIYNSSSNKKLVEEEFNYCLDCINALINELLLKDKALDISLSYLETYNSATKIKIHNFNNDKELFGKKEIKEKILDQAKEELENGK